MIADALDAGKATLYEGIISGYEAPHEAAENTRAGWAMGAFTLGDQRFGVRHGFPSDFVGLANGDRVRICVIDRVIVRIERR